MAASAPLTRLALSAASVADDLGYAALTDLSRALGEVTRDYRIIGGHMVTMLAARWQLGAELYRETGDVDLGIPPIVARDSGIIGVLKGLEYQQVAGNRFARSLTDVPIRLSPVNSIKAPEAVIDVLIPAYTSNARENVKVGDDLYTTEVHGLAIALSRPPVELELALRRLSGETLLVKLLFPDEVSALVLKSHATRVRHKDTDVADVWRCLEIAFAAGVEPSAFATGAKAESAEHLRRLFASRRSPGMMAVAANQRLPDKAADERYTRIRALISRVLGVR